MDLDGMYETPWRKTVDWNDQFKALHELKNDVENYKPLNELLTGDVSFPHVNILLYGGVGAGKSAVYNTFNSIFRGKIFNVAASSSAEHVVRQEREAEHWKTSRALTALGRESLFRRPFKRFRRYPIFTSKSPTPMKFKICDTRGLEPEHLMTKENMEHILEGHIADMFPFDPSGTVSQDMPGFNKYPKLEDRMHCVCLVQDASVVHAMQDLNPDITKNFNDMQTVTNSLDIPTIVILTKIDILCKYTRRDCKHVFKSPNIEECVKEVSEVFGLPRNSIFPMKNYEHEVQLEPAIDILALLTLKEILVNCDAHLFHHYDFIVKNYSVKDRHY